MTPTPTPTPTPFIPNYECWSTEHVPLDIEEIIVPDYTCNGTDDRLDVQKYKKLRKLIVGDHSYVNLKVVNLTGMENLEMVEIGKESFMLYDVLHDWLERAFYLVDCPKVTELTIGEWSLRDYSHFIIKNCSSLQTITTDRASVMASNKIEFEGSGVTVL